MNSDVKCSDQERLDDGLEKSDPDIAAGFARNFENETSPEGSFCNALDDG